MSFAALCIVLSSNDHHDVLEENGIPDKETISLCTVRSFVSRDVRCCCDSARTGSTMAAVAQAQRVDVAVSSKAATVTQNQSIAVCRNMIKAAIGQILYQRGVFDEGAFETQKMANTTVRCLVGLWF